MRIDWRLTVRREPVETWNVMGRTVLVYRPTAPSVVAPYESPLTIN
jgi:hypothetical protein